MKRQTHLVEWYQKSFDEDARHQDLFGKIQEARTKKILDQHLGGSSLKILDIGGATGVYTFYLASQGHQLTLLDIVPQHVEAAQAKARQLGLQNLDFVVSDILDWDYPAQSFDAVISHGPMYHLLEEDLRVQSMKKAAQLLKPGGLAFTLPSISTRDSFMDWSPAVSKRKTTTSPLKMKFRPAFGP
jgi:2-polyprenyl-3-methyl-5-hydroxy-6-metoxy-1,4-benzoquinol methylase